MKQRILIIDDEYNAMNILKANLSDLGYEVETAVNGPLGLAGAALFKPDVILLDVFMPGMDGGGVLVRLRENPETSGIPVIFITASGVLKSGLNRRLLEDTPVLYKPVDMVLLEQALRGVLIKRLSPKTA